MTLDRNGSWSSGDALQLPPLDDFAGGDGSSSSSSRWRRASAASSSSTAPLYEPSPPRYGWRSWTPSWLQRFNNPKAFLAFMSWFVLVQSFPVNGLLNVNTTTLQRRFELTSVDLGLLSAIYDIVGGLIVVPVSYYGGRGHKPRYLAVGSLFVVAGSLVMLLPHLLAGRHSYDSSSSYSNSDCSTAAAAPESTCDAASAAAAAASGVGGEQGVQRYLYVLLVGQGLLGYGGLVLYTLCPVFIDENVDRRQSPLYMGAFYAAASLAAAVGFLAGSRFLTVYVDAPQVAAPEGLSQDDPQWVGAWWLGYAVNACLAAPLVVFLFGIPRELPGSNEVKVSRVCEAHSNGGTAPAPANAAGDGDGGGGAVLATAANPANLVKATAALVRNPAFVCLTVSGICDSLFKSGVSQFLSQYIENQFNQTSSWAALLSGFVLVPGAIGGSVVGGWLPKKYGFRVRGLLSLCVLSSVVILLVSSSFLMSCRAPLADYGGGGGATFNLTQGCNAPCDCGTDAYRPVCGSDGLQHFSACHAGCGVSTITSNGTVAFSECACVVVVVVGSNASAGAAAGPVAAAAARTAVEGKCEVQCPLLGAFMALVFLGIFASFVKLSPWTAATMRVVTADRRAYAVGLQAVFIRLLGIAPGPVVIGAIIDSACLVWQRRRCAAAAAAADGGRGSCWLYESASLSHRLVACLVVLKTVSLVFDVLALLLYRAPPHSTARPQQQQQQQLGGGSDVGGGCGGSAESASAAESNRSAEYEVTCKDDGVRDPAGGAAAYAERDERLHDSADASARQDRSP